jgi:hypothetical protein
MSILNTFIVYIMRKRQKRIMHFMSNPIETQEETLKYLLQKATNTEFGAEHLFHSIKSYSDFKKNIPLQTYEDYFPWIERNLKGEQNLLWPTKINWFAKSSGTTNDKSKYIPVSRESLFHCHYRAGKDILSFHCAEFPKAKIFTGRSLTLGGSHEINPLDKDSYIGDLSAILIDNLPYWVRRMRSPKRAITFLGKWEEKIDKMAEETIHQNITSISGVPSWTMVFFNKVLEKSGKKNIEEVWPNLEMYMHGGIKLQPFQEQMNAFFPSKKLKCIEIYNASEGFFGIQPQSDIHEFLLMLDYGIFYEFIPSEEFDAKEPKTISLAEVELNKIYAVVISTNAGLWRYQLGDTIKFTSTKPHRFVIEGRTKQFINVFGEELMVSNADKAIEIAAQKCNVIITEYTVAPVFFDGVKSGAHEWIIEFENIPADLIKFNYCLDNALKSLNSDYETKRYQNMILREPQIIAIKKGTFYEWLKSKNKLGGQNKIPRLSNDRIWFEQIKAFVEK